MSEGEGSQLPGRSGETREIARDPCPHCQGQNLAAAIYCMWCGQALAAPPPAEAGSAEPALRPPPVVGAVVPAPSSVYAPERPARQIRAFGRAVPMSRLLPVVAVLVLTIMLSTGIALGLTASRVPTALQSSPAATSTAANGSGALPSPSAPLATAQRTATAGVAGLAGTSGPPGSPTEEPARTSTPLPRTPTHTATASPIAAVLATAIQATAIQAATDTPTTADTARSVSPVNPSPTATAVPTTAPTAPPQGEPRTPTPSAGPDLAATAQAAAQQQTATAQGASLEATSASIAATATAVSRTFVGCPTQAPGGTFSTQGERLAVTVSMRYLCRMGQLVAGQDARWIVFDVEMLNRSDAPAEINPLYFTLVNGEGRTQRPDNLAYLLPQPLPSRRLLANRTARGQIAFYTKRDFNPAHLVWRDFEEAIVIRLVRE